MIFLISLANWNGQTTPHLGKESCVMNGSHSLLATNAIIALLNANEAIEQELETGDRIGTSVVCLIEFLLFHVLTTNEKILLQKLMQRIEVAPVANSLTGFNAGGFA